MMKMWNAQQWFSIILPPCADSEQIHLFPSTISMTDLKIQRHRPTFPSEHSIQRILLYIHMYPLCISYKYVENTWQFTLLLEMHFIHVHDITLYYLHLYFTSVLYCTVLYCCRTNEGLLILYFAMLFKKNLNPCVPLEGAQVPLVVCVP